MTLLEEIGACAGRIAGEAPRELEWKARAHLLDSLVLMVAARDHHLTREAARAALPFDASGRLAFTAGVACDALGLDDFDEGTRTHPGAVVVPALLGGLHASARPVGGAALLEGVFAGYEITCRIGELAGASSLHDRGFHPSAVCGVLGSAAGLAVMLGGAPANAIGLAASLAGGVFELDGHGAVKGLQTGWAASSALAAARFAEAGYSPATTVLDGRRGLLRALGRESLPEDAVAAALDGTRRLERVSFKPYCHFTDLHPATAALVGLLRDGPIAVGDVDEIEVHLREGVGPRLNSDYPPSAPRLARRCPRFALAAAACRSDLGHVADPLLGAFDEAALEDPAIRALGRRVRWVDDLPHSDGAPAAVVTLRDRNGRSVTASALGYPGDGRRDADRWSWSEITRRSIALMPDHGPRLVAAIEAIETAPDARIPARRVAALLHGGPFQVHTDPTEEAGTT